MPFEIKNDVWFTGKIDWESRSFHGESMSTYRGTSYNSYLIKDKKTVLIDSVKKNYTSEFLRGLKELIELKKLDAVIALHGEPDHSGALSRLLAEVPDIPVYCSAMGRKTLQGHYHKDWNFQVVKTGDTLDLGERKLIFIETPMLHWPDTMTAYLEKEKIFFSSDIFGQHIASEFMYDDMTDTSELMWEAMKYYTNIIAPFGAKVKKSLAEIIAMNLPVNLICPAHGVMWRRGIKDIFETYQEWADSCAEEQITIIYDTMYDSTRLMAEEIAKGIKAADNEALIKIFNSSNSDLSDILTEVFRSKGVLIGSPTYNYGVLASTASLLEEIAGLKLSGKKGAAFGSYGWSPASTKIISEKLEAAGFEVPVKGLKINWAPDEDAFAKCRQFGGEFAKSF